MASALEDPQGSIWRRWDPHLHLPGTVLNDLFEDMTIEQALDELASRMPAIEVAGITDYCTTRSFRRAHTAWQAGAGSSLRYLFPNVELRLDVPTSKGSGVNVHLMCAPEEVDELDRFLGRLEFRTADGRTSCRTEELIRLGRSHRGDTNLPEEAALAEGTNQFKVSFDELHDRYREDAWASRHCLVAFAAGTNDGISGTRTADGAFDLVRQKFERFAHIMFTSNPKDVAFWSGAGPLDADQIIEKYGSLKPCLHGSDAHSPQKLGNPDLGRCTWIKGNPTFNALRMAQLAPKGRVHIGAEAPTAGHEAGRIVRVKVPGAEWFADEQLEINPGLVAIIGARGSGKTALADIIAAAAGSDEPYENKASFLRRAQGLLADAESTASVTWSHGEETGCELASRSAGEGWSTRTVRYLSQQFVEKLCAADGVTGELLGEIERVVFDAWPFEERQGATSFQDLLEIRLSPTVAQQRNELNSVEHLSGEVTEQRVLKERRPALAIERGRLATQLSTTEQQIGELTRSANRGDAERLALVTAALETRQVEMQAHDRKLTELRSLQDEVTQFRRSDIPAIKARWMRDHGLAGLTHEQWASLDVVFRGDPDAMLNAATVEAQRQLDAVRGGLTENQTVPPLDDRTEEQLGQLTVAELQADRKRLETLSGFDQARMKKWRQATERASDLRRRLEKLDDAVKAADAADSEIAQLNTRRLAHYSAYFDALLAEEAELNVLYGPLRSVLEGFGASVSKLQFSVKRDVDTERWAREGEELLDLRKAGPFRGSGELFRKALEQIAPAWAKGDGAAAAASVSEFAHEHSKGLRAQSAVLKDDMEAYREWERKVAAWLYSADHVTLSYSLQYDGLSVERLSPGTRGIVLLLLYLAVDQHETDPLIIDQPEENLDPESVYTELVHLFREASTRRQIIMVTHNANLVVNTDVDQVIVARCERVEEGKLPTLRYLSGGLEDPQVRTAVCEVLEGGTAAFLERARRLGLEWPSPD